MRRQRPCKARAALPLATTTAAPITASAASKSSRARAVRRKRAAASAGAGDVGDEEGMNLFHHRYVYFRECFSSLAHLYAELPKLRLSGREACTMALFCLPRNASLRAPSGDTGASAGLFS